MNAPVRWTRTVGTGFYRVVNYLVWATWENEPITAVMGPYVSGAASNPAATWCQF